MKDNQKERQYLKAKEKLLIDESICIENRKLFKKVFEKKEYELKRKRKGPLDEANYITLYDYTTKLRVVNQWFKNKPWKKLTKKDIQQVYDLLEDGKILNKYGKPYENLEQSYYGKIIKSLPFKLAGKLEITKEIIVHTSEDKQVRFILEEDFKKLLDYARTPVWKLLLWLAWDIGENINALLQLKKSDFTKEVNPDNNELEYHVNLRNEILKRARTARGEITNYSETAALLENVLSDLDDDELLFKFCYRTAKKMIDRAAKNSKVKCIPNGEKVTWKDLRSSMACHLLKKGYTTDEVNARLGHKPSSGEIDKYVNFLALNRHKPKQKVRQFKIKQLQQELEAFKEKDKLNSSRMEQMQNQMAQLMKDMQIILKIKA